MSNFLLMDSAKITSPTWPAGSGLLARQLSAEVDDEFRPISISVERLIGPATFLRAAIDRLEEGGMKIEVTSAATDGRTLTGVVRSMTTSDPAFSIVAGDTRIAESYRIDFTPED